MLCSTLLFGKPFLSPTNQQRTVYVHYDCDLDRGTGYWAVEEEIGQEGFVQEFEETVWVHEEASDAWVARHFKGGRRLLTGSKRGKRKGSRSRKWTKFSSQL